MAQYSTLATIVAVLTFPSIVSAQPETRNSVSALSGNAAASICDAQCVRNNAERATNVCVGRIENEAPGDYDWLQRPVGGIFKEADTGKADAPSIARYRGDSIRFLSPQREWVRAIYECGFDAEKQQVSYVRIRFGVLGKPSAVPVAPQQARAPQVAPNQTQVATAQATPVVSAPTSDRRQVGEIDEVSVLQIKPSVKAR
ncbi:hypothetical protein [Methylobacterium sp. NFXW15]|uniref:hypothetical protein n=1 Tax=Methylobacterium sp. NFXW15 TaxID=2819512 RepID=UPI003CE974E2